MPRLFHNLRNRITTSFRGFNEHELPSRHGRLLTVAVVLGVLALASIGVWLVWMVPQWQVNRYLDVSNELTLPKKLELEDAFRKTVAQVVLSVFGLLVVYFTWRRTRASDATVHIMRESHFTDRFTKAIEQLGQVDDGVPNIEARLGAIYILERIARDSPRDHWSIIEILTAYVRQNAPLERDRPYHDGERPRIDIQAVLTVLGRREIHPDREARSAGHYIDLMRTRLCGAKLTDANLAGADLEQAMLQGAILWDATLEGAALMDAELSGAKLLQANLRGAFFRGAQLDKANLDRADLRSARDLTVDQIQSARNWHLAEYSESVRADFGSSNDKAT